MVDESALRSAIVPGATVALADGAGMPFGVCAALSDRAREVGGVRLITGWVIDRPPGLDFSAFADVRTFMAGYGLAEAITAGEVNYVPTSLSQVPSLLHGPWRPDVAIVAVRETQRGLALGSEVSWIATAAELADRVLAEVNECLPDAAQPGLLAGLDMTVVAEEARAPFSREPAPVDDAMARLGEIVAGLVPQGATLQFGPGPVGEAVAAAIDHPVWIDSGIITDAVVDLAVRGLVVAKPLGAYVVGTRRAYEWTDGRHVLDRVEVTHDPARLASRRLVAVNTALEIDLVGQVNVERVGARQLAGIGGHSDYTQAAGRSCGGLSIIALPSARRGRSTLVDRLELPVSTPRSAVDFVVTENGLADLRGRTDDERARLIAPLFERPARIMLEPAGDRPSTSLNATGRIGAT